MVKSKTTREQNNLCKQLTLNEVIENINDTLKKLDALKEDEGGIKN